MRPFQYEQPTDTVSAISLGASASGSPQSASAHYLGGGTTLLDLMKLDVLQPVRVVDITRLNDAFLHSVGRTDKGLRIGALVTMAKLAADETVARDYPVLTQSLWLAASPQLRNMARVGGNVLQRTRCPYFRDTSYDQCNKRNPGSGCAAMDGFNRMHAVLGASSDCIATYPGDWAQALIALDASVEVLSRAGSRTIPFASLHREPGATPNIETSLQLGELITGFIIPGRTWPRSLYRKIRDRESYAFANASAAVALDLDGGVVRDIRIALGGVATVPWRARKAETLLKGQSLTEERAFGAAEAEFAGATAHKHNAFKIPLGKATLVRAVMEARQLEV